MLFRKRDKGGVSPHSRGETRDNIGQPELYRIDYDMMLKGSIVTRRGKQYRQFGVTVNGSTRLITSGDTVDRKTYEALVAVGAIRGVPRPDGAGTPTSQEMPED